MEDVLAVLEHKIALVVGRCADLRAENDALRAQLAQLAVERDRLGEKLDAARGRLEALLGQLPQP